VKQGGRRAGLTLAASLVLVTVAITAGFVGHGFVGQRAALPSYQAVRARWQPSEAELLDRHGLVIHQLRVDADGRRLPWVELSAIAPVVAQTVVAAEDHRFWQHPGVDPLAMAAVVKGLASGDPPRGASTITMQTASFLVPGLAPKQGRRTVRQKWRQAWFALALEQRWTKAEILTAYLNLASYRGEVQGIAAAAAALCGKLPSGLNQNEAAVLAALLANPNAEAQTICRRAQRLLAASPTPSRPQEIMALTQAMTHPDPTLPGQVTLAPQLAPHLAHPPLHSPGERQRTTLDFEVQRRARQTLFTHLTGLAGQNVRDGAVLVAETASGAILAYVAGGTPRSTAPRVDGILARRQAGSTLKPFLYGLALERRFLTPASVLEDTPLTVDAGLGLYAPQNYDRGFKGLVSLRTALASSLNVPAVRTLMLLGVAPFHARLQGLGYGGLVDDADHYGYALALGSAEVTLFEQVRAYRALARGGVFGPLRLNDQEASPGQRLFSPESAYLIADILSDRASRSLTFGLANPLATRYWSAVKTGTSKDMRDNWCLGWSGRYTVGVWVGNLEGDAMRQVSGVTGAAPVWREVMDVLEATGDPAPSKMPEGVVRHQVRFAPAIEPAREELFLAGTEQAVVRVTPSQEQAPRISAPTDGTVLAIDPEIPAGQQAILLKATGDVAGLRWLLDGKGLAETAAPRFWHPIPGRHELALASGNGKVTDRVRVEVRGRGEEGW
jgi:penicillin-binding protein 1C